MEKKLIKLSDGLAIYFTKKEIELFGLRENDIVDLSDMFLTQVKKLKKGKRNNHTLKERGRK